MPVTNATVQVAEGVGKFLRNVQRSIGGVNSQVQGIFEDEPPYESATVTASGISLATAASHLIQIMGNVTRRTLIRRILVWQLAAATAAAFDEFQIFRLTTAGTGGTVKTPQVLDPADAVTFTAMTLPTVKGTEAANPLFDRSAAIIQTVPATPGSGEMVRLLDFDFTKTRQKGIIITNSAAAGIALKNVTARAVATVAIEVIASEIDWTGS